jgi:hypothetical protein
LPSAVGNAVKSSGSNDAVHHIVVAFQQTAALSGTTLGTFFQLSDGATNQCCIVFRSDGAILLTSATPAGTVLATYTGAVTAANTWFAFEFEVVINATTGSFAVRKNGNTSNDFSAASLNTRPGTNAYANKLTLGMSGTVFAQQIDDLLWRSDTSSVPWVGDVRCYTRMPASDASVQFSRSPSPVPVTPFVVSTTGVKASGAGVMGAFTAPYTGTISSASVSLNAGGTGNLKAAIYDATRTTPLATSNAVVNPVAGANTITFGTPLSVTQGTTYYFAVDQDFSITYNISSAGTGFTFTTAYASFPATSPATTTGQQSAVFTAIIAPTLNSQFVNEPQQDGVTTYVYDSTVGHADFYNIAALGSTPASVVAVTTRGFIEKSDAGARTGTVQLKSGATTVAAPTISLNTNFGWAWRTDVVDPNTSAAWTPANVNAAQIGPVVIS